MAESKMKSLIREQMVQARKQVDAVKARTSKERAERESLNAKIGELQTRVAALTEIINKDAQEIFDLKSEVSAGATALGAKKIFSDSTATAE